MKTKNVMEEFVLQKTFILAKQIGFPETVFPSQSVLRRWLRENFNVNIIIEPVYAKEKFNKECSNEVEYYGYRIRFNSLSSKYGGVGKTYEKCLESALIQAINILRNES